MNELFSLIEQNRDSANVLAAVASAIAAALAFLAALVAVSISYCALKHQRKHDALTVRPLPEVSYVDYETQLRVKLRNNGAGPLVITRLVAGNGKEVRDQVRSLMPDLPAGLTWANFSGNVDGRSIAPGGSIVLLDFVGEDHDLVFTKARDSVRAALMPLTINVEYTDVYNTVLPPHRKSLEWFGQHLE